jgi:hypothetical protein
MASCDSLRLPLPEAYRSCSMSECGAVGAGRPGVGGRKEAPPAVDGGA